VSQPKSKHYARKNSRSRCHFTTADGRQCTEPRSQFCIRHSSEQLRDEDNRRKITVADIFGRHRKLTAGAITDILSQTMAALLEGRITHGQASALTQIARLMLRNLANGDLRTTLPLDPWLARANRILSGLSQEAINEMLV
jgi:hypothetical protein